MNTADRSKYVSKKGVAAFWTKDGLWHIALPDPERGDSMYWTDKAFYTRDEAIAAINEEV